MKKLHFILSIALITMFFNGISQDYIMQNTSIETCSGNFYDSGGAGANYGNSENFNMTFYPGTIGSVLKFTFTSFDVEDHPQKKWDYLIIYDGENTSSTQIGKYCGTDSPGEVIATNGLGALTFVFVSNKKESYPGWVATIECVSSGTSSSGIWTGSVSTDWSQSLNWDDGNIPGLLTDVNISSTPTGGNFPETNSGNEALCNDLTIQSGGHIYIPSNNSMSVFGEIYNNSGETGIVIKSDNSGTGSLIHTSMGVEATVERYLSSLKWHLIGMPVANEVAGMFDLPSGHSNIYLQTHNEATNTWGNFIVPIETPLEVGKGYITWVGNSTGINQDEIVEFNGMLNAGDYTTGQSGFYDLEHTAGHGLNLICNPYPSALNADIQNWPQANQKIAQSVWVWDPDLGNYRYWNGSDGSNTSGYGTLTGGIIPAMQGFFILATSNNPWLTIPQSSRVNSNQAYYKESSFPANTLKLEVSGNDYKDIAFVSFNQQATDEYDNNYDVQKLYGLNEAPQLYSIISEEVLSINTLSPFENTTTVDFGFECNTSAVFTINASEMESFEENISIFLEDKMSSTMHDFDENSSYTFAHDPLYETDRFVLHFFAPNNIVELQNDDVNIFAFNNFVNVEPQNAINGNVFIYNLLGQEIKTASLIQGEVTRIKMDSNAGYLIVKVVTENSVVSKKVFIK